MALTGKRFVITGGAGFIGTTLARRLVDDNEIVAVDNLHRDTLGGTALADHPNFTFVQGDVLDAPFLTEVVRGATHLVHAAAIAGVDTVIESPVRTMRVNLIGTYNALEAALADEGHDRALHRVLDERGLRHVRVQGRRAPRHDAGIRRRGALDLRRLEARR